MLQESLDHLKRSGFEVESTTTDYAFTLESKKRLDLNIGKNEREAIQKIGKILEIRMLRVTVLSAVIGTG